MSHSPHVVVIPARYASSRFPGKPLTSLAGKPMIQWVFEAATQLDADAIIIATDDQRIADQCGQFNAQVLMTSSAHPTGSDRLAEVVERQGYSDDTIIINLQGDEPLTPLANLSQLAACLAAHPQADMATLATPITEQSDYQDPNVVKVVTNQLGMAQYFSRAPIPYHRGSDAVPASAMRHIGMYAYRAHFLKRFTQLAVPDMEHCEQLEQLRALHAGCQIVVETAQQVPPIGVDTPADAERVAATLLAQQG